MLAMALPAKQKTWNITPSVQVVGTGSIVTIIQPMVLGIKNLLKAMSGVTVKGSSNSVAGAMDGVDRWTLSTNLVANSNGVAHSWIVLTFANMGGVDVFIGWDNTNYEQCRMKWSPGGLYTGGNATTNPTATDEINPNGGGIAASIDTNSSTSTDRRYSVGCASDGSAFYVLFARANTFQYHWILQQVPSSVVSPAVFTPAVVSWCNGSGSRPTNTAPISNSFQGRLAGAGTPTSFVTASLVFGVEALGVSAGPAGTSLGGTSDLQGAGAAIMHPLGIWSPSTNATVKGRVGNMIDIWTGLSSAPDGDTYPNDSSRQFIQVGTFVFPWDGSVPVLA